MPDGNPPEPTVASKSVPEQGDDIATRAKRLLTEQTQAGVRALFASFLLGGVGWLVLINHNSEKGGILGALGLLAATGMIVGGFAGFLFGVPRSLSSTSAALATQATSGQSARVMANTNLEQISDWLTKVLVGVGLTQLQSLPDAVEKATTKLEPMLPGVPGSGSIGLAVLTTYFFAGFLWSYVESRTALMALFDRQG
jgi:hypothetical protein